MTPIEKNIIVVDEQGNKYEATYPKRAEGLVKHGRARFINENIICLACPPYKDMEDNIMDFPDSFNEYQQEQGSEKLTVLKIFEELKQLRTEKDYIFSALSTLEKIPSHGGGEAYSPDDVAGQAKAEAIQGIVCCRETTNQKLIALYEKMYDDIMSFKKQ